MNPMNHCSVKTQANLQKLVEPLADYIAAVGQPDVVLMAVILLLDKWREVNSAADDYLTLLSKHRVDYSLFCNRAYAPRSPCRPFAIFSRA